MLHSNQVLSFFRPREQGGDWSQKDLAEFYRVEAALIGSGVSISTDRGLSDEGDPWFVFYRQDNEEVIVHFARIDGEYVVVSNIAEGVVRGRNFQALIRELLDTHPYVLPKANARRQTVYLHPATLLAALIVTGYIKSAELSGASDDAGRSDKGFGWLFNRHDLVTYSAILIAAVWDSLAGNSDTKFADLALFDDGNGFGDAAAVFAAAHAADNSINFDDFSPVSGGVHDHSILAAATLNLGEQNASGTFQGWVAANVEGKGLVYQAPSSHAGDSELPISNHEVQRLEKDGDLKSGPWHSDQDATELTPVNVLPDATAPVKPGSSTTPAAASVSTDGHSSSNPTGGSSDGPISAIIVLSNLLHVDQQSLHPVEISATNLTAAVQTTILELNHESGVTGDANAFLNLNTTAQLSNDSFHEFDAAAQHVLDTFLQDTAHYRIESFGHDLLIVDTDSSHFASSTLDTWKMADGSTLSIIRNRGSPGTTSSRVALLSQALVKTSLIPTKS